MKNIFTLKTDQKSNLYYNTNNKCFQLSEALKDRTPLKENRFVYITNSEKVIINSWYFNHKTNTVQMRTHFTEEESYEGFDKVVLTNDPQLIADGVQEIEKSVLISFAENQPDCVEVTKMLQVRHGVDWHDLPNQTEGRDWNGIYRRIYKLNFAEKDKKEEYSNTQKKSLEANKQFVEKTSPEKTESLMKEFDNYEVEDWISPMQKFRKKELKTEYEVPKNFTQKNS